jgi:hypothetical protein
MEPAGISVRIPASYKRITHFSASFLTMLTYTLPGRFNNLTVRDAGNEGIYRAQYDYRPSKTQWLRYVLPSLTLQNCTFCQIYEFRKISGCNVSVNMTRRIFN